MRTAAGRDGGRWLAILAAGAAGTACSRAAEVDVTRLPAPAAVTVDYERDVRPIFETACFRCHAGERPRSRYSLTDRESAVQGGALGVAIVPGDSAASPLIHYVARLVPDLEMPPEGKGEPLTADQVALLRAWVDQGAKYPEAAAPATRVTRQLSATPAFGWVGVEGNEAKFREQTGLKDEWSGGLREVRWVEPVGRDGRFESEVRALFGAEDYSFKVSYDHRDLGFLRGGYQQYRRWYDGAGGYGAPPQAPVFLAGGDPEMDVGRAWFEAGLARPELPRLTLGYEYQFKDGERSMTPWTRALDPTQFNEYALFAPNAKTVDEAVHVVRFDFEHVLAGITIQDEFRGEFADLRYGRSRVDLYAPGAAAPDQMSRSEDRTQYFQGANVLRLEKPLKDWLLVSAGYLYSNLDGDAGFRSESFIPSDPSQGPFVGDLAQELVLRRESHVFNANTQAGPWQALTVSAGVQADWTRQEGFGNASFSGFPTTLDASLDRSAITEQVGLRFTRIPFTVVHAEARFQQEDYGQYEQQAVDDGFGDAADFLRDSDASADSTDIRAGVTVSPWARWSWDAGYRWRGSNTDFEPGQDTDLSASPGDGYPAFIRARDFAGDEVNARVVWHAARWLKTSLKYQYLHSEIDTRTADVTDPNSGSLAPGGWLQSGRHTAGVYSLNATFTPWRRLLLNTTFALSDAETSTGLDTPEVTPYEGQIYTVLASLTYALDAVTDLTAGYAFSKADYDPGDTGAALPLGLLYDRHSLMAGVRRQFRHGLTASLQYGFFSYDEPTAYGAADYTAHGVFAWVTKRFE